MKKKTIIFIIFVLLTTILSFFIGEKIDKSNLIEDIQHEITLEKQETSSPNTETSFVSRIIDGDTIELDNKNKVRFIGIDTPETKDNTSGIECFGEEASLETTKLLLNKSVFLEKDISETDRYGRLLRYVYVDGIMINEYLVKNGFALASSYPPDVKYQEKFKDAERYARENNLGLWEKCK